MTRLIFDFPSDDGAPACTVLTRPVRTVTATEIDDVVPALRAVERALEDGLTAAGFIAYEAAPAFEPRMRVHARGFMPLLWFGLFEDASAAAGEPRPERAPGAHPAPWRLDADRASHAAAVRRIRREIAAGRTYQVNLTTRLRRPFHDDPLTLYEAMRRGQGAGYHVYLETDRFAIASASPELFFATRGREITTRPMKGTRPRGRWPAEDRALRHALAGSAKDRAENLMIVDLLRNDLGRIAATGSVRVPRLLEIEPYRTVWQMTSTVSATLRDDIGLADVLRALFPCGSVTGAPKISTMEVIAGLEDSPREVYCGAIGLLRPDGDATFSVPIRTAWIDRERGIAEYGTGGGVVWDSTPDAEYDELLAKTRVVQAPWPPFRLLETLRLQNGRLLRADRHLARLRASAARFGFRDPGDALDAALETLSRTRPRGVHRVRLLVDEDGGHELDVRPLAPPFQAAITAGPPGAGPRDAPGADRRPVALATTPVASDDTFLFHKTTRRDVYDRARAGAPHAWDVLLVNERGELTELTRGTLVVERDRRLLTPPLAAGLLPGCLRAELLDAGVIAEATLRPADLRHATRLWSVNSLRGWTPIALAGGPEPLPEHATGRPEPAWLVRASRAE